MSPIVDADADAAGENEVAGSGRDRNVSLSVRRRLDAVKRSPGDRCARPGGDGHVSVAVGLREDAVAAAADISGLSNGHVAIVRCIQILGDDAAESGAGTGDISRTVDQDAANAGRALLGEDAAAGLTNDGPVCGDRDRTVGVLNGRDAARRAGDGAGQVYAQLRAA